MSAWMEDSYGFCLELSGGIDSSALLLLFKSLENLGQSLLSVNYFHPDVPSSNEIGHARAIAQQAGVQLIELDWRNTLPFSEPKNQLCRFNRPFSALIDHRLDEEMCQLATSVHQYAEFVNGVGGDHIFLAGPQIGIIAELFKKGRYFKSWQKARELSELFRLPLLSLLKTIKMASPPSASIFSGSLNSDKVNSLPSWLNPESIPQTIKKTVPNLLDKIDQNLFPSTKKRIYDLYTCYSYVDQGLRNKNLSIIHPFLSQPIVEMAFTIPIENSFNHQYDRLPFRKAFSHHFNNSVFWRRSKGETTGVLMQGFNQNKDRIRHLCLEGIFSKNNLISQRNLEIAINEIELGKMTGFNPILNLTAIEIWAQPWGL